MDMTSFLIGLISGVIVASSMFALNWKYLRTKALEVKGRLAEPQEVKVIVTVKVIEDTNTAYPTAQWFDLPIDWERMVEVAKRVVRTNTINGKEELTYTFNYSLTGRESGNPLSRGEFDRLRDLFLKHGLLREKVAGNRRQGFEFTAAGKAYMRQWKALPLLSKSELIDRWRDVNYTHTHAEEGVDLNEF